MTRWYVFPPGVDVYEVEARTPGAAARKASAEAVRGRRKTPEAALVPASAVRWVTRDDVRPPSKGGMA